VLSASISGRSLAIDLSILSVTERPFNNRRPPIHL
jgi:hypothetical protein